MTLSTTSEANNMYRATPQAHKHCGLETSKRPPSTRSTWPQWEIGRSQRGFKCEHGCRSRSSNGGRHRQRQLSFASGVKTVKRLWISKMGKNLRNSPPPLGPTLHPLLKSPLVHFLLLLCFLRSREIANANERLVIGRAWWRRPDAGRRYARRLYRD